jgi:Protein of unknown function DUF2834
MSFRERVLLALTIIGLLVPYAFATVFASQHGFDLGRYLHDSVRTLPAAQLGADIGIAAIAFALWAAWEGRRTGLRPWWVPIPATLLVGLCFAIPLFLLLRERTLRAPSPKQKSGSCFGSARTSASRR